MAKTEEEKQAEANEQLVEETQRAVGRPGRQHVRVFRGKDRQYYVAIVAGNGEETFVSEGHKNRGDAFTLAAESFSTLHIVDETAD